jgi:integrase
LAGTIVKRGNNKYLVRLYIGLENGKRKYHSKTIHGTKKDAERYLNKILTERDTTGFIDHSKELLGVYLNRWLETVAKQRVSAKTYDGY